MGKRYLLYLGIRNTSLTHSLTHLRNLQDNSLTTPQFREQLFFFVCFVAFSVFHNREKKRMYIHT